MICVEEILVVLKEFCCFEVDILVMGGHWG